MRKGKNIAVAQETSTSSTSESLGLSSSGGDVANAEVVSGWWHVEVVLARQGGSDVVVVVVVVVMMTQQLAVRIVYLSVNKC
jgi:hypothetical protein